MKPSLIDIPVAVIFFSRPDLLLHTFEAIRAARPSKLFLIQDGPRVQKPDDADKINECRNIVNNIDWDCEVQKNYSDDNLGCGMRVYSGISWAFEQVDRLVIIEDDCVPSEGFFIFCKEILEKYKDDDRIDLVSGMNHLDVYDYTPYDYFFSEKGAIWGWATWKRSWDTVDFDSNFLYDKDAMRLISNLHGETWYHRGMERINKLKKGQKLTSWTYQVALNMYLNSRLIIIPKVNLVSNIGLSSNATNSTSSLKFVPKGLRSVYFMKAHKISLPLKHPKYVVNDIEYKKKIDRILGHGHPIVNLYRLCESMVYRVASGNISDIKKGITRRLFSKK